MPCGTENYLLDNWEKPKKLAERGLSPEEIAELQARANLAREKAKATSWKKGETLEAQQKRIDAAVTKAVEDWHIEQHARLKADLDLMVRTFKALTHATESAR